MPDLRGLLRYSTSEDSVAEKFCKGHIDTEKEMALLISTGMAAGFIKDTPYWLTEDVAKLAELGYLGRLYWDLPPEVITMDEFIEETDKYRDIGSSRTNNDSSIWIPDQHENGLSSEQWNGPSRDPQIRLAVFRAKTSDPGADSAADRILHGLKLPYAEQYELANSIIAEFNRTHNDFEAEALTQKGVCAMLLSDRLSGVPIEERILAKGFMRVMFGWWYLYGNENAPRCGSVTLSNDWFIMNESAGYPYPTDGFGLSIGIKR